MGALNDILHFLLYIVGFHATMAALFTLEFQTASMEFNTFGKSLLSLGWLAFGEERYDFELLRRKAPWTFNILVFFYLIFMVLIMFNLFIAILTKAFDEASNDPSMHTTIVGELKHNHQHLDGLVKSKCQHDDTAEYACADDLIYGLVMDVKRPMSYRYSYAELAHLKELEGKQLCSRMKKLITGKPY